MQATTTSLVFKAAHLAAKVADVVVAYRTRFSTALRAAWAATKQTIITPMTPQQAFAQLAAEQPGRFVQAHTAHWAYFPYATNWQAAKNAAFAYVAELRNLDGVHSANVQDYFGVEGYVVCATLDSFRTQVVEPGRQKQAAYEAGAKALATKRQVENEAAVAQAVRTGKTVFVREYTLHEQGDFMYCKDFARADGLIHTSTERDGNG